MQLKEFELSNEITAKTQKIGQKEFSIQTYLPISDKIDLIQIALQKAEEDGIYNELKLDAYFHLNIVYLYTDIEFSEEDRKDELVLYDILEQNHVIDMVVSTIGEKEYNYLVEYLDIMKHENLEYKNTAAAVMRSIIQDLPKNAAAAKEIMDSFDPNKYQEVVNFATAANGGRNINTNTVPFSPAASQEN